MANNNGHHSFYREQQKSILGQEKWTAKRIGKLLLTLLKWFLWGFLIVATLWGCVNEFIIQTSNNLGQGVEFYQANDFVYPNTYQAVNMTGYTSSKVAVEEGKIDRTDDVADLDYTNSKEKNYKQTTPFNFIIMNPDFGKSDEDTPTYGNNTDLFINTIDYVEAGGSISAIYYNLNLISYWFIGGLDYLPAHDAKEITIDGSIMTPFTLTNAVKDYLKNNTNTDTDTGGYAISNTTDFYFYMLDMIDGTQNNEVSTDEVSTPEIENVNWDEDVEDDAKYYTVNDAKSLKGSLVANNTTVNEGNFKDITNWNIVMPFDLSYSDDDEKDDVLASIQGNIKQEVNLLAFNNGTGIADSTEYLALETTDGKTLGELYLEEYVSETGDTTVTSIDPIYDVDYSTTMLASGGTNIVYGGAQTIVVPIKKGFPVRISDNSKDLISSWRGEDFYNWDTSKTEQKDAGFDIENQMYGWTILDANSSSKSNDYQADVMRVYDTEEAAISGDNSDLDESHAFYADQRRLGWGLVDSQGNATPTGKPGEFDTEDGTYSVFDEKVKSWMNDTKYVKMQATSKINGKEVQYNYATEFAGLESVTQATYGFDKENPSYFYGTTPEIEHVDYKGKTLTTETSLFSDSIIATGQDAWGESRITFIGWSDWGKAWDVQYGPLYGAFVFPLAQLAMMIGTVCGYMASAWGVILSIIIIVFLTRGLGALLSLKGTSNQMKMQEVQNDVAKIKAKYSKYDLKEEPRMKQKQQQEIMALYRKKEINPMGSLGTIFITMPIFISLWIIISALPAYKVVFMGNFSWAVSSFYGIFNAGWLFILYLMVGISVGLVQGISSKLPTWLSNKRKGIKRVDEATKEASKKQNKTQNIMIGVFVFMGLTVPALFAFYWICSGFFTIILELVKHAWKVHVAEQMKKDPTYQTPYSRLFKKKA